jgi:hypothetical protein
LPFRKTGVRFEKRIPMAVPVRISGHVQLPGTETTFTENVSAHGARVLTIRRWSKNDLLQLDTLTGEFHACARVAYCVPVRDSEFAIGLEFVEPAGHWIVPEG